MQKKYFIFIIKFLIIFIVLNLILSLGFIVNSLTDLFIFLIKPITLFFKEGVIEIIGNAIVVNNSVLIVDKQCTGIAMYSLFAAFAIAYKAETKTKLKGLAIGVGMLILLNLIRLIIIVIAAYFSKTALNFVHDLLWPATFFIFTLIVGYYYIKRCSKLKKH
jgi:exosortase/archaeosortase family protein